MTATLVGFGLMKHFLVMCEFCFGRVVEGALGEKSFGHGDGPEVAWRKWGEIVRNWGSGYRAAIDVLRSFLKERSTLFA